MASSKIQKVKGKKLLRINAENRDGNDSIGAVQILSIRIDEFSGVKMYDRKLVVSLQNTIKVKNGSQSISYLSYPDKTKLTIDKYDSIGMLVSGKYESVLYRFATGNDSSSLKISKGKFENVPLFITE